MEISGKSALARLFADHKSGLEWPDFNALGAEAHPSFGIGPIYRGRLRKAKVLIFADQQSHDDLFTGRALCGKSAQFMQTFLNAMGLDKSYAIIRVLPVDTLGLSSATVAGMVSDAQIVKVYQAIVDKLISVNKNKLKLLITFGPHSKQLVELLHVNPLSVVHIKAWDEQGAVNDWKNKLTTISVLNYNKDISTPTFIFSGKRGQIPRYDLPYGVPRFMGTSRDRARRPFYSSDGSDCYDYYRVFLPQWVFKLKPVPLSLNESAAISYTP